MTKELKEWLINEINNSINFYNESTYLWSSGYRKACLNILDVIKIIEQSNTKK